MKRKRTGEAGPEIVLPITPMLDMAFQLLTFFIFTYHPSGLEGQMELSLPSDTDKRADQMEKVDPSAKAEPNPNLELPADLVVILQTQTDASNKGILSAISVEERSGKTPLPNLEALFSHLEKVRETVQNKTAVKLLADSRLRWDAVVDVMDTCRKAGFNNISFAPPPDYNLSTVE